MKPASILIEVANLQKHMDSSFLLNIEYLLIINDCASTSFTKPKKQILENVFHAVEILNTN